MVFLTLKNGVGVSNGSHPTRGGIQLSNAVTLTASRDGAYVDPTARLLPVPRGHAVRAPWTKLMDALDQMAATEESSRNRLGAALGVIT
jgi:hypothetical protein